MMVKLTIFYHDLKDSEKDYIPSDNLLSDNRTNDEGDYRDENMFELDPSTSDIRINTFTSRNKSETWESEPTKTPKDCHCSHNFSDDKTDLQTKYNRHEKY